MTGTPTFGTPAANGPVAAGTSPAAMPAGRRGSLALLRAMRLDYETLTDSGIAATAVSLACPLVFPLLAFLTGAVGALAISLALTVGYWALASAGLFVNTNAAQSGRLSALLPATRARQVAARYLSAAILGVICLIQLLVQTAMLWLIETLRPPSEPGAVTLAQVPLPAVIAVAMAAFVLIVALEMPFYYALEFTKASSWFWSAMFMIAALVAVGIMLVPDSVQNALFGVLAALPAVGWAAVGVVGCAAALTVSYAVSRHIWLNKEL